ncbi:MAG: oxidoreductase [Pseudomonadota bacterium]|nr:oxidoreductase [Pseudomonadota bacterium]
MDKWNLIVDVALCENCNNCVLAAKDEFVGNEFPGYSAPHAAQGPGVIRIRRKVRGQTPMVDAAYLPVMCNHCDDAPCVKAAADGSIAKRPDGIVMIDPVKAKGRRDLVDACPYGALVWNETQQLPQNWFFDAHLLDSGWAAPRCVGVCPTAALEAAKLSDAAMSERVERDGLRTLHPQWATRPRVYYRHLERFDRCFIGGSVSAGTESRNDCVAGASVELHHRGALIAHTLSDSFGDFKFDALTPGTGLYEIVVRHTGHVEARLQTMLEAESIVLDCWMQQSPA